MVLAAIYFLMVKIFAARYRGRGLDLAVSAITFFGGLSAFMLGSCCNTCPR